MKKMLLMLMFLVGCMTSLAALDLGPPQKGVISQSMQWEEWDKMPTAIAIHQEVNILHRDNLMYSSKEIIYENTANKIEMNGVVCGVQSVGAYAIFKVGWQTLQIKI